jgi:hypothetical protein
LVFKIVTEVRIDPRWYKFAEDGVTRQAMAEELNAFASKSTTQIRRLLSRQTKLPYSYMVEHVTLMRAYAAYLTADINVVEKRTPTLGRFMTSYTKRPTKPLKSGRQRQPWVQKIRLRVWEGGIVYPRNPGARPFVIDGGRAIPLIAVRTGLGRKGRGIKVLSGPNIAGSPHHGEIERKETGKFVEVVMPIEMLASIEARIERIVNAA